MTKAPFTAVATTEAPAAVGPYSQAIVAGDTVYCAGQIPLDPATGQLVVSDIATATARAILNLESVLRAAGLDLSHVVKTTVYLTDMADFAAMNEVYARHLGASKPARACVAVAALPKGARIEIDAIAVRPAS